MIEQLPSPLLSCGEGPAWHAHSNKLYWCDSNGDEIYAYDAAADQSQLHQQGRHTASLCLHETGGLMCCGKEGFALLLPDKTWYVYENNVDGIIADRLNDIVADANGRVFAGQDVFNETQAYPTGYLFRLDVDGRLHIVEEGLHLSNGMGFSPDNHFFYLADTIQRKVFRYHYDLEHGELSQKQSWFSFNQENGLADGLAVDAEGYIWIASFLGGCILRIDPDGKMERKIDVPFAQPTSLTFGGDAYEELYITSAGMMWQTPLAPQGHDYSIRRGGHLYRMKTEIHGRADHPARVHS